MSTNALICITHDEGSFWIYKHHDGYPAGIKACLERALERAWPLPRFESDEFAAAFVAANKTGSGDIRLVPSLKRHEMWFDFIYRVQASGASMSVAIGHCTGMDDLDRITYDITWEGDWSRMHEAYEEDAA